MISTAGADTTGWPALPFGKLQPTSQTLQLWTQIVGKVRLSRTPWINHGWHVTLRVSARGLRTPLIPHGARAFDLEFDFVSSELVVRVSDGGERGIPLASGCVAEFHAAVMDALSTLGVPTDIVEVPNEIPDSIPFPKDERLRIYDAAIARDFWRALVQVDRVFNRFRTRFLGKCSPVHLFWGSFDLAVTRFSGRPAPPHPGGVPHLPDAVTREAYSHEVSSAGFWPGGGGVDEPCFYSYAYPTPEGFAAATVSPPKARFEVALGEFVLPYEAVRTANDPEGALLAFLQSTYEAAANLARWDRAALECPEGRIGHPRPIG
jgi:hypothetical protein